MGHRRHTVEGVRGLLALLILWPAVAACGSGEESSAIDGDIDSVLAASSAAMTGVRSAAFTIEKSGASVFIDNDGLIDFQSADGRYAAPSRADAILRVRALGLNTEVGAVAVDGQVWFTNPLTGAWEAAPESFTFDPTTLFDPEVGWSALLSTGLEDPELVEPEPDADRRYRVRGVVGADRVGVLTGGLVDEPSVVDLLIDAETGEIGVVTFDVGDGDELTSWVLTITDYGVPVTITAPDLASTG